MKYNVNEKTFSNHHIGEPRKPEVSTREGRQEAENFSNYPKSSFDEVVYYEIYTHHGDHSNAHTRCNGAFDDAAVAYREMQNYSNDWCSNGTGWMEQVILKKGTNGKVIIQREKIYEN